MHDSLDPATLEGLHQLEDVPSLYPLRAETVYGVHNVRTLCPWIGQSDRPEIWRASPADFHILREAARILGATIDDTPVS